MTISDNPGQMIWLNGKVVPVADAQVNVLSATCQFGANVFEGIRGYWNDEQQKLYLFRANDHWARLIRSIRLMKFEGVWTIDYLRHAVLEAILSNGIREDVEIRQTVFLAGIGTWHDLGPTGMFVRARAKARSTDQDPGLHCCVSSWERIHDRALPPRIKLGANYMNSRLAHLEARQAGYDTALLMNRMGTVSEAPGSCIFIIRDGQLITPPVTASILESITRVTIKEIAEVELGLMVIEREIDRTELYIADEILLCGSAMEVRAVVSVDQYAINSGLPGPITTRLRKHYLEIARGLESRYSDWLTSV